MLRLKKIHKLNLTHLHELDFKAYEKKKGEEKRIIKEQIDNFGLLPESPKTNIFTEAGIDFSNNQMTFVHPLYFYNHLKTAGMLEFNPYAGKKLEEIEGLKGHKNMDDSDYDLSKPVKANPGFAPFDPEKYGTKIGDGYTPVNTYFLEKMPGNYPHEGIDFDGRNVPSSDTDKTHRSAIKSFIKGVIVRMENHGNYNFGKHMIVSDGDKKLFLLGHLYDYADNLHVGSSVYPGQLIGYVGNTGHCGTNGYDLVGENYPQIRANGAGSHLHLTVFLFEDDFAKKIVTYSADLMSKNVKDVIGGKDNYNQPSYYCHTNGKYKVGNPFDYSQNRS